MRWRSKASLHSLSGVYALDAMAEPDRRRFERHLARCPSCQREVAALQETATRFAVAVSGTPPPRLKTRVLAAVAAEPAAAAGAAARPASRHGATAPEPGQDPWRRPASRPRRTGPGWIPRLAVPLAAASLVVVVVLGVLLGMARGQLNSTHTQEDEIADVLSAPGAKEFTHRTTDGGSVTVDFASSLHELVVTSFDVRGLPSSEAYQVWVQAPDGKSASDGMLTRIPGDRTAPVVASGVVAADKVDVTVEPASGTAKPTTSPIATISL